MVVVLPAFDPRVTVANTLSGGVNTTNRALLLSQGTSQVTAAGSLQAQFASRIYKALANLNSASSSAVGDSLLREQARLIGNKARLNEAIEVVSKAVAQFDFLKNHITYLQDQLKDLESASPTTTAAAVAIDFDNKLRKINQLALAASETIKDGKNYYPKNLINSTSRTTFSPQTVYAPYNSKGDLLQINGIYLGTDYYITDGDGDFWNSDTGFAVDEASVGTLTEYDSINTFPSGATGTSVSVDSAITAFTFANDVVNVTLGGVSIANGTVTRGGLGLLDAFLYANFDTTLDADAINRAQEDLQSAESLVLTSEAELRTSLATMESRVDVFNSLIDAADTEVVNLLTNLRSGSAAEILSAQLEFEVTRFDFALLASRGNTLIKSMILAQDNTANNPFGDTTAMGEFLVGTTVNVLA